MFPEPRHLCMDVKWVSGNAINQLPMAGYMYMLSFGAVHGNIQIRSDVMTSFGHVPEKW